MQMKNRTKLAGILFAGLFLLSAVPVIAANSGNGRKLIYVSTGASKIMFGECQWHRRCYPRRPLPLSYFLQRYEDQLRLSSWGQYWGPENWNQSEWHKEKHFYFLGEANSLLFLAVHNEHEQLEAIIRLRPDGSEEEFRPMFIRPENSLTQYSEINFLRLPRNFTGENISSYQVLSMPKIEKDFGLSWGATLADIQKRMPRDFEMQDPNILFTSSNWFFPEWSASFKEGHVRATSASWSDPEQLDIIYYAFKRSDDKLIRILKIDRQEGLFEISDYSSAGGVRKIRRKNDEIKVGNFADLTDDDLKRVALSQSWEMPPRSSWPSTGEYELVNPLEFFLTRGKIFVDWERRFSRSNYTFDPDLSWTDSEGYRYYIFWKNTAPWEKGIFASEEDPGPVEYTPRWFMQRYSKDSGGLDRIFLYDYSEVTIRPYSKPHLVRVAVTNWFIKHWLKCVGLLFSAWIGYVIFSYRKHRRELENDIREMEQRRKEKEEREKQEQEIRERKLEREREREREERRRIHFGQQIQLVNYYLKSEHFQGAYEHLERLLREFPKEQAAILQAKQRVMDAEQAALKEKHKDMSEKVKLIRKMVPPPEEESL